MEKFGKKFEIYNFEVKEAKIFFFRSKNPKNLRGFCPPNQK
jgi:hypothetical protein